MFSGKKKRVRINIYTKAVDARLTLTIKRFNEQFGGLDIQMFRHAHDRFLIIDEKDVYHIGASLKDLGKKWFAFSKLHINPSLIPDKLPIKV